MVTRHGVLASPLKLGAPDEVLGIDQRVADEACAADHADEFLARESIPLLARHLRVIDLGIISRVYRCRPFF